MTLVRPQDWRPQGIASLEDRAWEALRETDQCVCVTAGAGSGKTELLAQKATYLLQTGICPAPKKVLAISFKRDAAAALSARVRLRLPRAHSYRFVSMTFDAWTKGLLDQFRRALPSPYAPDADYDISFPTRDIANAQLARIGSSLTAKQLEDLVAATKLPLEGQDLPRGSRALLEAYWQDQYEGRETTLLTFTMINRLAECMLRQHAGIRAALRATYPFVFLDEFQDTTSAQFELVGTAFCPSTTHITTVGDDKQRIMGWAGAMPNGFQTFSEAFHARRVSLLANWRSHADLVAIQHLVAAHIDPGVERAEAKRTRSVDGQVSAIWVFRNRQAEVDRLASWLATEIRSGRVEAHDIVLLVRLHADRVEAELQPAFEAEGIVLRNLARSVGEVTLQDLLTEELTTLLLPLLRASASTRAPEAWSTAVERMTALRFVHDDDVPRRVMRDVETLTISVRRFMAETSPKEALAESLVSLLVEGIGEDLIRQSTSAYQRGADYGRIRDGFVSLLGECMSASRDWQEVLDRFEGKGQVPLMTIHKSKGMEFHTVVFFGLDGQSWWSLKPMNTEEMNSFFVALTRAEQRAFFTCCAERGRPIGWVEELLGDAVPRVIGGPVDTIPRDGA
ncbi:UvrD-helicase domain-containing protein [Methylobacterium marchantiae]|uniref:DNA 3'-5' helicase n=1 Tax=Methylobacterium marchantiae TaxID=600331 RepID=A0ABW3X486_9HYPH|nr:ATP-dependent DNA helicase Rep [Methylobacterium marchantiae]